MLEKIIYGSKKIRKSRLHDEKGNFVGWNRFLRHFPHAASTGVLRISVGYRPQIPWISYDAIKTLRQFLTKDSRVLEFGSGMSTLWYANYAGEVCSVEDYLPWYQKVSGFLGKTMIENVNYCFADSSEAYCSFMSNDTAGFDLIMVDGSNRSACIANSLKLLKPGGILYLDNSDKHSGAEGGDTRIAEACALTYAKEKAAAITYFTDFAPTQFFVQQGLMIKTPAC